MREVSHSSRAVVSLDRAQLIGLGFFAILSGGLMFGLGYGAGKNRRPVEAVAVSGLTKVDQNAALHDEIRNDVVDLGFYKALVEKEDSSAAKPRPPAPAPAALAEPKPRPAEARPEPKPELKPETKPADTKPAEVKPAPAAAPADKPSAGDSDTALTGMMAPALVEPKPEAAAPTVKPAPAAAAKKGELTVQVSAFKTEGEAAAYVRLLQAKGFAAAHVVAAAVPGKGVWYRVRIGKFGSQMAADAMKARLGRENISSLVVKAE